MMDKDHKQMYTRRYFKNDDISLNKNILDPNDYSNDHDSIKVWNLDYSFEEHIDRQEPTEDQLSISTKAQIAVGTRSIKGRIGLVWLNTRSLCEGIWNFMTGKLQLKLANTALGALNTQALVNNEAPPGKVDLFTMTMRSSLL